MDYMEWRCVSHIGYLMHGNSKVETRRRIRQQNESERGLINLESGHKYLGYNAYGDKSVWVQCRCPIITMS